jgi:hypothetical protein
MTVGRSLVDPPQPPHQKIDPESPSMLTAPIKFRRANPVDKGVIQRISMDAYVPACSEPSRNRPQRITARALPPRTSAKPSCGGPGSPRSTSASGRLNRRRSRITRRCRLYPQVCLLALPALAGIAPVALRHCALQRPLDVRGGAQTEQIRQSLPLGPRHHRFAAPSASPRSKRGGP